jgi:hypothetical protein
VSLVKGVLLPKGILLGEGVDGTERRWHKGREREWRQKAKIKPQHVIGVRSRAICVMTNGNKEGWKRSKVVGAPGPYSGSGPSKIGLKMDVGRREARYNFTKTNFFINIR